MLGQTALMSRRSLLRSAAGLAAAMALPGGVCGAAAGGEGVLRVEGHIKGAVKIASIEVLRAEKKWFVRSRSTDGAVGLAITNDHMAYLYPLLQTRIIPFFIGKDARQLEGLLEGVHTHASNYKLVGLPFWCAVSFVECSLLDMLGKMAGRPVGELLGGVIRKRVPVYMSSMRRDTSPQQEVDWLARRLEETGARAVKLKIGGRMSRNADAFPGRTDQLIPLARKTFGEKITIYVDANGSYDAARGIEVGKMLEDYNVGFYEEPCPFEEYEQTRRVAEALKIPVAGGEQDTSLVRFEEMIRTGVVDIVQPDVNYNGGLIRAIKVARMAAARKMPITPHSPKSDANEAYMLHFVSCTPNAGPFQEFNGAPAKKETWYGPAMEVKDGALTVPEGPGLGIGYDEAVLKKAEVVR